MAVQGCRAVRECPAATGVTLAGDQGTDRAIDRGIGLARDQFATKPLLYAENDELVVLSSEEVAIRAVFPDDGLVPQELGAKEVRWWLS